MGFQRRVCPVLIGWVVGELLAKMMYLAKVTTQILKKRGLTAECVHNSLYT
jgi:hypothetical protein